MVELYKSLPEPKEYPAPTGWLIASVIGWVITPILLVWFVFQISQNPNLTKQLLPKSTEYEKMLKQYEEY